MPFLAAPSRCHFFPMYEMDPFEMMGFAGLASNPGREPHPDPGSMRNALFPLPIDGEGARG
jgi:hypothetical protein